MHYKADLFPGATFAARDAAVAIAIILGFAAALLAMGRPPICPCGTIELWHGGSNDGGTSQHLSDWYSLSHVIHGFIFYGLAVLIWRGLGRPLPLGTALCVAILVEGTWELIENSPWVIERYRTTTASDSYVGDSVLNSVSDICFMVVGFFVARVSPAMLTVAAALAMELLALIVIRDNLTLNVLMIVHPIGAIQDWQMGR